jgi:hypothetical protein
VVEWLQMQTRFTVRANRKAFHRPVHALHHESMQTIPRMAM